MKNPILNLLLVSLYTTKAFRYEATKTGHCPYKPGDIKSPKFNSEILSTSQWLNIYDRKELNDHHTCYSVRFEQTGEDSEMESHPHIFEYLQLSTNIN